jgi:hypothetical protein
VTAPHRISRPNDDRRVSQVATDRHRGTQAHLWSHPTIVECHSDSLQRTLVRCPRRGDAARGRRRHQPINRIGGTLTRADAERLLDTCEALLAQRVAIADVLANSGCRSATLALRSTSSLGSSAGLSSAKRTARSFAVEVPSDGGNHRCRHYKTDAADERTRNHDALPPTTWEGPKPCRRRG